MNLNPRVSQFQLPASDSELDARIAVPAKRVTLLGDDAAADSKLIGDTLRAMFIPDRQTREVLRTLLAVARAHADHHFGTDQKYLAGLYANTPWGTSRPPAVCFTGQAGSGKSQILLALGRLLSHPGRFSVEGHRNVPLVGAWPMTLAKGDGLNHLLREHVEPSGPEPMGIKGWRSAELLKAAARVSWRSATCLMPVDEFQWIAASSTANARASTVLLKLHGIGPILVFCANFSLIHKLRRRPPEDRDRLLSCPIILEPHAADDLDWMAYLEAARGIAPDVLTFSASSDGQTIHRYTFGIKRKVVDLIAIAVKIARRKSAAATVGCEELLNAYRSADYAMHRDDVEALFRQDITGRIEREDLWCPFISTGPETAKLKAASAAIESFERRMEEAILADAMMPSEATAHQSITTERSPRARSGKVVRLQSRKVTKESLLEGAAALDALE